MNILCGHEDASKTAISELYLYHLIINGCSHFISQLKNMISASQDSGTEDFMKNDVTFG